MNYLDINPEGQSTILLLHGLGANCDSWALQVPALVQAGWRVIAPDIPGFGKSPYDGKGWSFGRISQQLAQLLTGLGVQQVALAGLSMGGVIAQQFALDYPEKVQRLILVSTFSHFRPRSLREWAYFIQRAILVQFVDLPTQARLVSKRVFPGPEYAQLRSLAEQVIAESDPRAYRAAMRSLFFFNSTNYLENIHIPTLVLAGDRDSTIPVPAQRLLAERIPGAQWAVISGAGHALTLDHAEAFNQELLAFLS